MAERVVPAELTLQLENYATMFLSQGRKDWDVPHTKSVVFYAGEIAKAEGLDILVLTTAGWLHDIGYYGLFEGEESKQYEGIQDKKALHMIKGAILARQFFETPGIKDFYTEEQMARVVHIISMHDKIEELKDADEIAFMEADTLGAIDISRVKSTFDKEGAKRYIEKDLLGRRRPKFQTATGIKIFNEILPTYLAQYGL